MAYFPGFSNENRYHQPIGENRPGVSNCITNIPTAPFLTNISFSTSSDLFFFPIKIRKIENGFILSINGREFAADDVRKFEEILNQNWSEAKCR